MPRARWRASTARWLRLMEEVKKQAADGQRVVLVAGSLGELERLADIFNEYQVPYMLGERAKGRGA